MCSAVEWRNVLGPTVLFIKEWVDQQMGSAAALNRVTLPKLIFSQQEFIK